MLRILSKILIMVLILILVINICPNAIYAAIEVNLDNAYLQKIGQADYHLKYYRENTKSYTYVVCSIVGYYNKNGDFYPTYCMNKNLSGAEEEPYYVTTQSLLNNNQVWRVIKNGYPYKSAKELGLTSSYDAYAVTKFAVYCILGESDVNLYKAEKNDAEAVAMLNALKNLVDIGLNGKETQDSNPLSIESIGTLKEEVTNEIEKNTFYSQEYKVASTSDFSNYQINAEGLPEGAFIANLSGTNQDKFTSGENFKIMIPNEKMLEDFHIKINVQAECKAYIILEGKTTVTDTQNYVVTAGEYSTANTNTELLYNAEKGRAKIIKIDSEDNSIRIPNVSFDVMDEQGNVLETIVTNESGEAITSEYKLRQYNKLYFRETSTLENYVLNNEKFEVELSNGQVNELIITNEKIKGKIQIKKLSKDDNKITGEKEGTPLKGVEFEIYDEENNLVEKVLTDEQGIAVTSDLLKGKYTVRETKTNKYYFLNKDIYEAEIKENGDVIDLEITNESKNPDIDIEKNGVDRAEVGSKIEYDISIRNTGNTGLKNVVMEDIIPEDYIYVNKFQTGTFNQNVKYNFYYKTNFSDDNYILMMEDLDSNENYEIDFSQELSDNEYVTAIKMEFESVDVGFSSNENPHIIATIKNDVKSEDTFINKATIVGFCEDYEVNDNSKWKTTPFKLLPKTGK